MADRTIWPLSVAGGVILFAGLFDMMDGRVARLGNMSSKFGALYDSVLDRYSELMTFFGICYYLSMKDYFLLCTHCICGTNRLTDGKLRACPCPKA